MAPDLASLIFVSSSLIFVSRGPLLTYGTASDQLPNAVGPPSTTAPFTASPAHPHLLMMAA